MRLSFAEFNIAIQYLQNPFDVSRQFPSPPRTLDFFSTLVMHFGNPASAFGWIVAIFSAGFLWLSISQPEGVTSPVLLKAAIIFSGLLAVAAILQGHLDSARAIRILKKGAVAQGAVVEKHNVTQKYRRIGAKIAGQPEYNPGSGEIKGEEGPAAGLGDDIKYVVQFKARDGKAHLAKAKANYNPGKGYLEITLKLPVSSSTTIHFSILPDFVCYGLFQPRVL